MSRSTMDPDSIHLLSTLTRIPYLIQINDDSVQIDEDPYLDVQLMTIPYLIDEDS